jgi:hypothetical protein
MSRSRTTHQADIHQVLSRLSDAPRVPDLSRSIMGRLGYMQVTAETARRRRLSTWANRAAVLVVAGLAFAIGWRVFEASPHVRRPAGATVPEAIHRDMQMQQQHMRGAIRGIRTISTPRLDPGSAERAIERDNPPVHPIRPQELQDDVNRSSIAPVRWV